MLVGVLASGLLFTVAGGLVGWLMGSVVELFRITSYNVCYTKLLRIWNGREIESNPRTLISIEAVEV